ncbi:PAS-domain containing protein [Alloyangia mangrovi]|uniref:PAS-domain containing protein n=1 Tax=Alloyangia mangrovi TaxID=1779329 RepID=UPI0021A7EA3F|nr:PAS-domain containing protein [Alloyangia mangrovi]
MIGDRVVDLTGAARSFLETEPGDTPDWPSLRPRLETYFGPLPSLLPAEPASYPALGATGARLLVRPEGRALRLSIEAEPMSAGTRLKLLQEQSELPRLRRALALVPCPIWQSDETKNVIWCNAAYEDACAQVDASPTGPAPFDLAAPDGSDTRRSRTALGARGEDSRYWYEVQSHRNRDGWMHFATNIDAIIRAEINQRSFLQTLTRIFAHLPIGLAVFDRDHRLVLFNPALIDLTGLQAEFLSTRPNLMSVFDTLREGRMMPEPKNYKCWRDHLTGLIAAASSDLYIETWELPSGLTYRITGRPHPDAGIAFLFEDISSEITLTRRFRQELEQAHSVLDSLEEAVAVFFAARRPKLLQRGLSRALGRGSRHLRRRSVGDRGHRLVASRLHPQPDLGRYPRFRAEPAGPRRMGGTARPARRPAIALQGQPHGRGCDAAALRR